MSRRNVGPSRPSVSMVIWIPFSENLRAIITVQSLLRRASFISKLNATKVGLNLPSSTPSGVVNLTPTVNRRRLQSVHGLVVRGQVGLPTRPPGKKRVRFHHPRP